MTGALGLEANEARYVLLQPRARSRDCRVLEKVGVCNDVHYTPHHAMPSIHVHVQYTGVTHKYQLAVVVDSKRKETQESDTFRFATADRKDIQRHAEFSRLIQAIYRVQSSFLPAPQVRWQLTCGAYSSVV